MAAGASQEKAEKRMTVTTTRNEGNRIHKDLKEQIGEQKYQNHRDPTDLDQSLNSGETAAATLSHPCFFRVHDGPPGD